MQSQIIHADSTTVDWGAVLGDRKVRAVITDPPFGVAYQSNRAKTAETARYTRAIDNDGDIEQAIEVFNAALHNLLPFLEDDAELYVFTAWSSYARWEEYMRALGESDSGFGYRIPLIWDKSAVTTGDIYGSWTAGYEMILYAKRGRFLLNQRRSSVLTFYRPHPTWRIHPTEKPAALLEELIVTSTHKGEVVVDLFSGSGSTVQAAQNQGRIGIGVELDDQYVRSSSARLAQAVLF